MMYSMSVPGGEGTLRVHRNLLPTQAERHCGDLSVDHSRSPKRVSSWLLTHGQEAKSQLKETVEAKGMLAAKCSRLS